MKFRLLISISALSMLAVLAMPVRLRGQNQSTTQELKQAAARYTVIDLGTLGGTFSEALGVNNRGLLSGAAAVPNGTEHAFLWKKGQITDIGTPGLGGPNSMAFDVNERGSAAGPAETPIPDPNGEDFCGFGTHLICLSFLWQDGVMTPLPTLGGNNGSAMPVNNRGQVAGVAENSTPDSSCAAPFQVLDFEAVIWGPRRDEIQELPPLAGDSVGEAIWMNDLGQAVGSSGSCANTLVFPIPVGPHAVLWENGSPTDLGNLGGSCLVLCKSPILGPFGNTAIYITNEGQVVGVSALPGETTFHAFLWTREIGMQDLGTLPGDVASVAVGMNDRGQVVGVSFDASGNLRGFLWQNGTMTDLNTLIPADSPLFLLFADIINSRGEIVGFGVNSTGEVHGFLATPVPGEATTESATPAPQGVTGEGTKVAPPENARALLQQRLRFGRFGVPLTGAR